MEYVKLCCKISRCVIDRDSVPYLQGLRSDSISYSTIFCAPNHMKLDHFSIRSYALGLPSLENLQIFNDHFHLSEENVWDIIPEEIVLSVVFTKVFV